MKRVLFAVWAAVCLSAGACAGAKAAGTRRVVWSDPNVAEDEAKAMMCIPHEGALLCVDLKTGLEWLAESAEDAGPSGTEL